MSRIVQSETPGNKRAKIFKLLVNLMPVLQSKNPSKKTRNDVIAFIILSLNEVQKSLDDSIRPWEKRGYWTKADQFKAEWAWVEKVKSDLVQSELPDGWIDWPKGISDLFSHLGEVKPTRKKLGNFWDGAYALYKKQSGV